MKQSTAQPLEKEVVDYLEFTGTTRATRAHCGSRALRHVFSRAVRIDVTWW